MCKNCQFNPGKIGAIGDNAYYYVSTYDNESYSPVIVYGKQRENWKKYCQRLVPKAVKHLLERIGKEYYIGTDDVITGLIEVLVLEGYKVIELEEFSLLDRELRNSSWSVIVTPELIESLNADEIRAHEEAVCNLMEHNTVADSLDEP